MAAAKKSQNRNTAGVSPDPFLRSFLRQAVAVIAADKGLTDSSREKLKKIASELGLSDRTFHDAIEQLKDPGNSLGLNRYEQTFVDRISKELQKFKGDVLSIRYEKRLAEVAENKYQIPPIRAHQLIQKTAEQNNIGIISHSDAQQSVQNLIEDSVGKRLTLDQSEINRLGEIGEKWGIPAEKTENQISALTLKNRRRQRAAKAKRYTFYATSVLSIVAIGWFAQKIDWASWLESNKTNSATTETESDSPELTHPQWWTDQMVRSASTFSSSLKRDLDSASGISSDSQSTTENWYTNVVDSAVNKSQSTNLDDFLADAFYHQPDTSSANSIANRLASLVNFNNYDALTPGSIRRAKRAIDLSVKLAQYPDGEQPQNLNRRNAMAGQVRSFTGNPNTDLTNPQLRQKLRHSLALQIWAHSLQASTTKPKSTAASLGELEQLSTGDSPEINELRLRTCQMVIAADPIQWNTIKQSIKKSIDFSNASNVKTWTRIAVDPKSPASLRGFLANNLAKRLNLPSTGGQAIYEKLKRFNRYGAIENLEQQEQCCQILQPRLQKLSIRLQRLGIDVDRSLGRLPANQLPELILAISEINADLLSVLNQRATPDFLRNKEPNSQKLSRSNFPSPLDPTPSQRRKMNEAFAKLRDRDANQMFRRLGAIDKIREQSKHFESLQQDQATELADYILSPLSPQESLAVERALPDFRRWERFKLAIADRLQRTSKAPTEISNIMNRLQVDTSANDATEQDWRKQIQHAIAKDCHKSLTTKNANSPEHLMWSAFDSFYSINFRNRISSLRKPGIQESTNPDWEMELAKALNDSRPWLKNHVRLIQRESSSINKWTLANHLVAEFIGQQQDITPDSANQSTNISTAHALLESEIRLLNLLKQGFQNRLQYISAGF